MALVDDVKDGKRYCCFCIGSKTKNEGTCSAQSPKTKEYHAGFYGCTREPGHSGMHVACGVNDHAFMAWTTTRRKS